MDNVKIGNLIYRLRREKQMTQQQVAERLCVSNKAVSKWERGLGCPEVSLLPELSKVFAVDLEKLLSGELDANDTQGGNMKKLKFYVCQNCGNLITAMAETSISCCGKKLSEIEPRKAEEDKKFTVEMIENDYFITSEHEMTREHYITFIALVTGDSIMLRKQYPEWDVQVRIPAFGHGRLLWYCSKHGLYYQLI